MDLHGGSISVFSAGEGRGTTFSVKLPVYREIRSRSTSSERQAYISLALPQEWARQSLNLVQRVLAYEVAATNINNNDSSNVNNNNNNNNDNNSNNSITNNGENTTATTATDNNHIELCLKMPSKSSVTTQACAEAQLIGNREERQVSNQRPLSFLIVDDVALTRKMMRRLLNDRSSTIDEAGDGQQAVDMLKISCDTGTPYDIVLMDYQMPIMDGPSAAQAMRQLGYTGLILGVSGHTLEEDSEHFLSSGADKVLTKPINLKELDTLITNKMSSN